MPKFWGSKPSTTKERYAYIRSNGMYVPEKVVTNEDLTKLMDTSNEWIVQRTGINERRYADIGVNTSDLAKLAVENMLSKKEVKLKDIDCLIFATCSPDFLIPGTGVLLQDKLGISKSHIPCYDIRQQCSGYIYGLQMAKAFIETGVYENILVVGAELHSHALEMNTRGRAVSVIFGDGAACSVISATNNDSSCIISTSAFSDGAGAFKGMHGKLFDQSQKPIIWYDPKNDDENIDLYPVMASSKNLFTNAVRRMVEVAKKSLKENDLSLKDIKYLLPHQANMRINQMVADYLKVDQDKVLYNIHKYGNTTAATIPLLLSEFTDNGTIKRGDLILMVSFGVGFTWGSALIRY